MHWGSANPTAGVAGLKAASMKPLSSRSSDAPPSKSIPNWLSLLSPSWHWRFSMLETAAF
jgi:hypothetical protein